LRLDPSLTCFHNARPECSSVLLKGIPVNRAELQQLAEDRIFDAEALLANGRWSGAYYLAGYAVECGLKSCVLSHILNTGAIFLDRKFSEKCWTHSLEGLLKLAGLEAFLGIDVAANPTLGLNWLTVESWNEFSRYQQTSEFHARRLFAAVTDHASGVMTWIRGRW
jgi:HEPN domain-containing protein